ncbi:DUF4440 domain-containing protein, partial [Burkholderia pseudomallei]
LALNRHVPTHLAERRLAPDDFIASRERIGVLGTRRDTAVNGRTPTLKFVQVWRLENVREVRFVDVFESSDMIGLITA